MEDGKPVEEVVSLGENLCQLTEEVIDVEDFSYHGLGVGVRGKWEPGLGSGSRICGSLPPGNFSPPIQFLSLILCTFTY